MRKGDWHVVSREGVHLSDFSVWSKDCLNVSLKAANDFIGRYDQMSIYDFYLYRNMKRWSRHQFTRSFQPMSRRRPIVVTVTYWLRAHCAACQWIHGYMLKSNMGTPTCSPQSTLCHILWVVTNSWDSQEWRPLESVVEGRQYSIAGPSAPRCWSTICAQTAYR